MDALIVIPARFASTRFPGKPLTMLRGANGTGRTLIERSWLAARRLSPELPVVVATDDDRIAAECRRFGAEVVMTSPDCRNGTERCAEVAARHPADPQLIVNFQGDAPLTPPDILAELIRVATEDKRAAMVTPAIVADPATRAHLIGDRSAGRVGGTTVVFDAAGCALYFSKEVLPFAAPGTMPPPTYLHLGLYAYRREALATYAATPPSPAEESEGLEQLRFLHAGVPIRVVACPAPGGVTVELNNPEDVPLIEAELKRRGWD